VNGSGQPNKEQGSQVTVSANKIDLYEEHMGVGEEECTMAIIPVRIKHSDGLTAIQTYAFLDPGSSVTFCTENLMQQLGIQGNRLKIKLQTMSQPRDMFSHALVGLEISGLKGEGVVKLPKVYTTDQMPVSTDLIPTQDDLSRWPHLRDVKIPKIDAPIGLLIGNNVPDAYAPIEIRSGPRNTPHAIRTLLDGWHGV
jgi:hypothetical protein